MKCAFCESNVYTIAEGWALCKGHFSDYMIEKKRKKGHEALEKFVTKLPT